jgi:hypothetical protein
VGCLFAYRQTGGDHTEFGFYSYYNSNQNIENDFSTCRNYDKNWGDFDLWFNAAKTFSSIAVTVGGLVMIGVLVSCCCSCGPVLAYWGTWGMVICGFSQGFTLLVLVSQECQSQCSLNTTGIFSMVAVVLWFLGAVVVSQLPVFLDEDEYKY